jgi:hypothetical protein
MKPNRNLGRSAWRNAISCLAMTSLVATGLTTIACSNAESDWTRTLKDNSVTSFSTYISKYPQGTHISEAKRNLGEAEWNAAVRADAVEAYEHYLAGHPDPQDPHVNEAKQKIDQAEWVVASKAASISSYERYLAAHATGLHAKEAQEGIEKLEPYEKVSIDEFKAQLQSTGRIEWDANGLTNGGPVRLSFGGHSIRLTDPMIRNSLISTADYGKIQFKGGFNGAELFLKPSQQRKLRAVIATR